MCTTIALQCAFEFLPGQCFVFYNDSLLLILANRALKSRQLLFFYYLKIRWALGIRKSKKIENDWKNGGTASVITSSERACFKVIM